MNIRLVDPTTWTVVRRYRNILEACAAPAEESKGLIWAESDDDEAAILQAKMKIAPEGRPQPGEYVPAPVLSDPEDLRNMLLARCVAMLEALEFSVDTHGQTGRDTVACPRCGAATIRGLEGEHRDGCELAALLNDFDTAMDALAPGNDEDGFLTRREEGGVIYAQRDHAAQGEHYTRHVEAMTREGLHSKSAIAGELAARDIEIERLIADVVALRVELDQLRTYSAALTEGCIADTHDKFARAIIEAARGGEG